MMMDLLVIMLSSTLGTLGFAILLHAPRRAWLVASLIGGLGYTVYWGLMQIGWGEPAAIFTGVLAASVLAQFAARKMRMIATIFITLAIIPCVPGLGTKYTFKVVPCSLVNGEYYADASYKTTSIYTLKKVSTPTVSKYSSKKVKVSWKNISGESGYQISLSTSKSKTKIVTTYSTTSGKSKTLSAAKGKTYYCKVRAYKTVDGKKIYAPWSSVKTYKFK